MPVFAEMKTWTDRLGHTSLRSFTDRITTSGSNRTRRRTPNGPNSRARDTRWHGSSPVPVARIPAGSSSTARSTRPPKRRRNSSRPDREALP